MRCKKHFSDLSSSGTGGVCATCLRERLFALIATQAQHQAHLSHAQLRAAVEDRLKPISDDSLPPVVLFPRSVSPYASRRKSDYPEWSHLDRRFYSTPQVGPTNGSAKKKRFSIFSSVFRSRSEKVGSGPGETSWFSNLFSGRRKNKLRPHSTDGSTSDARRPCRRQDRGMSPVTTAGDDDCDVSPSGSPQSPGISPGRWRRTPVAGPPATARKGRHGHSRNVSGLAFCLSPLVRASPSRQWKQNGVFPPEMAYSGEVRVPAKPHLSTASAFCANRSRKLADIGRLNHNR